MRRQTLAVVGFVVLVGGGPPPRAQGAQPQPHGNLAIDCGECHDPERWTPLGNPPAFQHDSTGFKLQAAHAGVSCRSCHDSLVFHEVGTACADCHKDAHRGELGFRCETCHSSTTWTNQRQMFQVHNRSRYPLLSIHARLDCSACHREQRAYEYATTPAECGNCHYSTYLATTDPNHVQAGFSRRCEDCHGVTSTTWRGAAFAHPASFPLVRGHSGLACQRCHQTGRYGGLSTDCASCHLADYNRAANPNHVAGGFPKSCQDCHTIDGWRPAIFDHSLTRFPLTGAHSRLDCARCHEGGRYTGTPTACVACHRAAYDSTTNPSHASSGFPTSCQDCHTTNAWRPATFDHDSRYFPIYSGRHRGRWSSCSDCHVNPGNYRAFECILCHEHSDKREVDDKHKEVGGYSYNSAACYRCHPAGRAEDFVGARRLR